MSDMMKMIIGQMDRGKEVLRDREILTKHGRDYTLDIDARKRIIDRLHPEELNLKVASIREINKDAKTFRMVTRDIRLPVFESGQYINIFVEIDGVRTSRPYSISSSNRETGYYDITIGRIENGFVSDYFLDEVKVGDEFEAKSPGGTFKYDPIFHSENSVFLAGGSGITPFMSMTREVLNSGLDRNITLIYGCRNSELVFFREELEYMAKNHDNFEFHIVLSEPEDGYQGLTGFIDEECIRELVDDVDNCTYYICGPQVMNDFVSENLEKMGIRRGMIRKEMFGSRQDIENEPGWPKDLDGTEEFTITIGDKKIKACSNESVLTSLERNGIEINVQCRSGECSLCRVKLISGKVFMPKGVLLRHADEMFGYIHSCKAYPMEDLEIII